MAKSKVIVPASILDAVVPIVEVVAEVAASATTKPPCFPYDAGWTEYVLEQMDPGEVYQQTRGDKVTLHPTVAGLRGFVDRFFKVVSSMSHSTATLSNGPGVMPTVTVEHTIAVEPREGFPEMVSGVACAGPHNLSPEFAYPGECAETRSEARAMVRLLRLKTCSKEEIANPAGFTVANKISPVQVMQLKGVCKTLDINMMKLLNSGGGSAYKEPEDFPVTRFPNLIKFINELQQNQHTQKDVTFLEKVKGYEN